MTPTHDPDRPVPDYGVPGYRRGKPAGRGRGSIAMHKTWDPLDPRACAERYLRTYRTPERACAALERDAGDPLLRHHFMRVAARMIESGEVACG